VLIDVEGLQTTFKTSPSQSPAEIIRGDIRRRTHSHGIKTTKGNKQKKKRKKKEKKKETKAITGFNRGFAPSVCATTALVNTRVSGPSGNNNT
jgi:hypothetical protein